MDAVMSKVRNFVLGRLGTMLIVNRSVSARPS